jgi:hypothetical protein
MNQPNTGNGNPTATGVTVPPEVWAQMQQLLANFGPPNPVVSPLTPIITPKAPIVSLLQAPSIDLPCKSITQSSENHSESDSSFSSEYNNNQSLPSQSFEVTSTFNDKQRESLVSIQNNPSPKSVNNHPTASDSAQDPETNTLALRGVITNLKDYNYSTGREFPKLKTFFF